MISAGDTQANIINDTVHVLKFSDPTIKKHKSCVLTSLPNTSLTFYQPTKLHASVESLR